MQGCPKCGKNNLEALKSGGKTFIIFKIVNFRIMKYLTLNDL